MVKIAFSSPFAGKEPVKDAEALVTDKDPEYTTHGVQNSTGRCLLTLLGLAFILAGLIVGGACIYKYFMPRNKMFEGKISFMEHPGQNEEPYYLPISEDNDIREDIVGLMDKISTAGDASVPVGKHKVFEGTMSYTEQENLGEEPYYLPVSEEAEIWEDDNVALINVPVPNFSEGDPAAIVHDFGRLLTAYLDLQLETCYVIELNTSIVMPPRNMMDLFRKIADNSYLPRTYLVREDLVVSERIDDVSDLGYFIYRHCLGKATYRLQRRDQIPGLQKRSAEKCVKINHFENKFVTETRICQL
ncbi:integral membrane protein 2A isoform 1-T1 [Rhinophrynus dorsalis]